jgi:hypothetical protein
MREGSMAARLLMLVVLIMLVFAALCGCAQEAANDRQPMKRVKEPTTAEIAVHTPQESDDHLRRAKRGVVVRAGNTAVVARAGEAVVSVGDLKTAKGEGANSSAPSGEVTLKIEGSPGTEFSGTCIIGGKEEKKISGRVPKRFIYDTHGQRLECQISNQSSNSGEMKVEFSAGGETNSVQQSSTQGGSLILRYESHGSTGLVTSSTSVWGDQANSTSQVSVLQSNSIHGRDSH